MIAVALPGWQTVAEADFHRTLRATAGVALVLFGQPGCGACRAALHRVPSLASGSVGSLWRVDVSVAAGLSHEFALFHLPALYLYRDGVFHAELRTALQSPQFAQALATTLGAVAQEPP